MGAMKAILLWAAWAATALAAAPAVYVSPSGSDANPGTWAAPLATLEAARTLARAGAPSVAAPATVWLRGGDFLRTNTFTLSTSDTNCVYRAVPGETPRLLGGPKLTPAWFTTTTSTSPVWARLAAAAQGAVVEVDLAAHGITNYGTLKDLGFGSAPVAPMELFINGQPQVLARWPNAGTWANTATVVDTTSFTYSGTEPSRWTQAEEVWVHGMFYWLWADSARKVTRLNTVSNLLTLDAAPAYGLLAGKPYFAFNLIEEIDTPGEYYLKRDTGKLYLWPPAGFAAADVVVSVLETPLVEVTGAQNIDFDGLTLLGGRGVLVQVDSGTNVVFSHCRLLGSGAGAASINGTSNGLMRCEIAAPGGIGVSLNGGNRSTLTSGGNFARQCNLHDLSRLTLTYTPGASLNGVGQVLEHCEIANGSHNGIMLGGNEHHIESNDLHDLCQWTSDAGAVYTGRDWGYRGNMLRYNFIHNVISGFGGSVIGIYLDDCVSGLTLFGNVLYRVANNALMNGGGRDNLWQNNLAARCGVFHAGDARGITSIPSTNTASSWDLLAKIRVYNYQSPPWSNAYPAPAAIPNDYTLITPYKPPGGTVFSRNVGWANTNIYSQSSSAFSYYAEMVNNLTNQDPLFVNEAALDLTLQTNSPAYSIPGFQAIPFKDIGITPLMWTAKPGLTNAQDGAGVWSDGGSNWWAGVPETWYNMMPAAALFGAATGRTNYTVTLGGNIIASSLTFAGQNYTLAPDSGGLYTLTLAGAATVTTVSNGTIGVPMAGSALSKWGAGQLTLTGTHTYSGPTTINAGTLQLGDGITDGALAATSNILVATNCVLAFNTLGNANFSQPITGPGSLAKSGGGTVTLTATNTYAGATAVSNGTMVISGGLGTGVCQVATGAMLAGKGIVKGPVTVASGGTIAPGATSPGTLTISNSLTLSSNAFAVFELNKTNAPATNDYLFVTGTLRVTNSTLTVRNLGPALVTGDRFVLLSQPTSGFSVVNLPGGYFWTNKLALDGSIAVLATIPSLPTNLSYSVSGRTLNLRWPSNYVGWILQSQTNPLNLGLRAASNAWFDLPGTAGVTATNLPLVTTNPSVFFRLRRD